MPADAEGTHYTVRVEPARFAAMSARERDEAEAAAIARILDRMHAPDRDEVRSLLESGLPGAPVEVDAIFLVSSSDPEIAGDMSIIASVRAARAAESGLADDART